jgi:hypothetical protein
MKPQTETYLIPTWSLSYLINGDGSGLEDSDIEMVDNWINQTMKRNNYKSFTAVCPDDVDNEKGFYHSNDMHNLGDDCVNIEFITNSHWDNETPIMGDFDENGDLKY